MAARRYGALLALLLLLLAIGSCGREEGNHSLVVSDEVPQQAVQGMILRESKGGRLRWVLRADSAEHYGDRERTTLLGVNVAFYNDRGDSVQSWLTARSGEVDPLTNDLIARDSVVVWTHDGNRLETDELRYDQKSGKVLSECFVRLTRGSSVITGVGIESDASLKSYVIRSEVEGDLHEQDSATEPRR